MKPTIQVLDNETGNGYIVVMEKELGIHNNDMFLKARETRKFKTTEKQVFIDMVESVVINILSEIGIIPYDNSESALESAFDILKRKYHKNIIIKDRYKDTKETIVYREPLLTIIIENGILSMAQEIEVVDL